MILVAGGAGTAGKRQAPPPPERADHPNELQREKFLSEQALRTSGMPWTILRPAPSMERWTWVVGENVPSGGKALVLGRGENPVNFVSAEDVASVVVDAATAAD